MIKKGVRIEFGEKIFKEEDIFKIYSFILSFYNKSENKNKRFRVSIKSGDSETYSFEGDQIKDFKEIIGEKNIGDISINFSDYLEYGKDNQEINFYVSGLEGYAKNYYLIDSFDNIWTNGVKEKIKEILDSIKPQNIFFRKYSILIGIFITFNISILLMILMFNFVKFDYTKIYLYFGLFWIIFTFIGMFLVFKVEEYFKLLFPKIEFDFGPEHYNISKKKRNSLYVFFSFIIIPFIINLITGVFKF